MEPVESVGLASESPFSVGRFASPLLAMSRPDKGLNRPTNSTSLYHVMNRVRFQRPNSSAGKEYTVKGSSKQRAMSNITLSWDVLRGWPWPRHGVKVAARIMSSKLISVGKARERVPASLHVLLWHLPSTYILCPCPTHRTPALHQHELAIDRRMAFSRPCDATWR